MTTIMPQSELLRNAVSWIAEQKKKKQSPLPELLQEAGMRYNLSPKDQEFLKEFFSKPGNDA